MSTYTYIAADLRTNAVLDELPLTGVDFTDVLKEPGEMSASLPLFGLTAAEVSRVRAATRPARTALYVDCDGTIVWGGILWKRDPSGGVLRLSASGFLSHFARVRLVADKVFTAVDQFSIARSLITSVTARTGGDIGITLDSALSGVPRTITYLAEERPLILELIQQLGDLDLGFDFAIRCGYDTAGVIQRYFVMSYPQAGRTRANTDLLFDYPGNIGSYSFPEEADRMVTTVYVRGEGTGTATPSVTRSNSTLLSAGYPRLEEDFSLSGVSDVATLGAHADALLAALGGPVTLPVITLPVVDETLGDAGAVEPQSAVPELTTYAVGDVAETRITDDTWFPSVVKDEPGFNGYLRILQRKVTPDLNAGGESVELTCSPFLGTA